MTHFVEQQSIKQWLLLAIVCCCAFFVHNEAIFVDIMESRNLITAREMVYDGNWLTPTMNGELRLEKPPLPTWIAAGIEWLSPDNLALQRAMAGAAAILLVIYLYKFACLLVHDRLYALIAALLLCTSYSIILMGRTASWDIYCHAFMMVAIYYLFRALQSKGCQWRWLTISGLMMGLSFLGKGPVSFYALLLPFLCAYLLYYRQPMPGKWKGCAWMLLLMLLLSSWWYVYLFVYHPEMTEQVLKKESTAWVDNNVRPWWYYWKFFLETGAWSLLTICTLFIPVWKRRLTAVKPYYFTLVWMLGILFFLSLVPEKKSRYLLPVVIPAVLTCAHLFMYWIRKMRKDDYIGKLFYRANVALIMLVAMALPVLLYVFMYREMRMGLPAYLSFSFFYLGIAVVLFYALYRIRPLLFLTGVVLILMSAELFMMPYIGTFVTNKERKSISQTRNIEALKPLPFYYDSDEVIRIELVYAAYKKIQKIDLSDSATVSRAMPFVLVSKVPAEEILPSYLKSSANIQQIDVYNDNPWPEGHRRYNETFISYVTLIQNKKTERYEQNK